MFYLLTLLFMSPIANPATNPWHDPEKHAIYMACLEESDKGYDRCEAKHAIYLEFCDDERNAARRACSKSFCGQDYCIKLLDD